MSSIVERIEILMKENHTRLKDLPLHSTMKKGKSPYFNEYESIDNLLNKLKLENNHKRKK